MRAYDVNLSARDSLKIKLSERKSSEGARTSDHYNINEIALHDSFFLHLESQWRRVKLTVITLLCLIEYFLRLSESLSTLLFIQRMLHNLREQKVLSILVYFFFVTSLLFTRLSNQNCVTQLNEGRNYSRVSELICISELLHRNIRLELNQKKI